MSDMMDFPKTVEEFMEMYKMVDTDEVYSNGTEYVPIFRMKQWFEHQRTSNALPTHECVEPTHECVDLISRQAAIDAINKAVTKEAARWSVKELPSQPVGNSDTLRGEWKRKLGTLCCSVCGNGWSVSFEPLLNKFNYCPNCGAEMGGEK